MCKAPAGKRRVRGIVPRTERTGSKPKMTASGAAFPERRRSRRSSPGYARETVQRISQRRSPLCPARSASPAVKRRRSAPFSPGFGSSGCRTPPLSAQSAMPGASSHGVRALRYGISAPHEARDIPFAVTSSRYAPFESAAPSGKKGSAPSPARGAALPHAPLFPRSPARGGRVFRRRGSSPAKALCRRPWPGR